MNAEEIKVEWDEDGCYIIIDGDPVSGDIYASTPYRWRVNDPEQLYDRVKAAILPWLMERDEAAREATPRNPVFRELFACDPDESVGYDRSDPKHPDFHSVHADIWDAREGK